MQRPDGFKDEYRLADIIKLMLVSSSYTTFAVQNRAISTGFSAALKSQSESWISLRFASVDLLQPVHGVLNTRQAGLANLLYRCLLFVCKTCRVLDHTDMCVCVCVCECPSGRFTWELWHLGQWKLYTRIRNGSESADMMWALTQHLHENYHYNWVVILLSMCDLVL